LRQLRENGQSFRQLAQTFNVSKTTIIRYLRLAESKS
ncbi:MAG: helix-turn-helix domain-containing protein, partial [Gammaproteobacteria bacterium]|nr:helix-turn-helix domain-containing protein [Gammaproteobacteria bacterium]